MNEVMRNRQLVRLAVCLVGMAAMVLQSCMESNGTDCDRLCGSWSSVEGKPDVLVYKEGEAYKVTVFSRSVTGVQTCALPISTPDTVLTCPIMKRPTC